MPPARQPPLRSTGLPYGFRPRGPATQVGAALGLWSLGILAAARRNGLSGALEYPRRSELQQLHPYQRLLKRPGIVASWVACCGFTQSLGGDDRTQPAKKRLGYDLCKSAGYFLAHRRVCPGGPGHVAHAQSTGPAGGRSSAA